MNDNYGRDSDHYCLLSVTLSISIFLYKELCFAKRLGFHSLSIEEACVYNN